MTDDELDQFLVRADADIQAALDQVVDTAADLAQVKYERLRPTCDCGTRVKILWSSPLSPMSRPFLLVCRQNRCDFRQRVEEHHLS